MTCDPSEDKSGIMHLVNPTRQEMTIFAGNNLDVEYLGSGVFKLGLVIVERLKNAVWDFQPPLKLPDMHRRSFDESLPEALPQKMMCVTFWMRKGGLRKANPPSGALLQEVTNFMRACRSSMDICSTTFQNFLMLGLSAEYPRLY